MFDLLRNDRFQQALKTALLLGLAVYFTVILINGNLANYINLRFAWLSVVAVLIFGALGVISLIATVRGLPPARGDFVHERVDLPIIMVMAVPLVLGTALPSAPLGVEAINGTVSMTAFAGRNVTAIVRDPLERNVLDWAREFTVSPSPATFNGQEADFIGFVYTEPGFPPEHFMVARFMVSCCVADASPLGLPVAYENTDTLPLGQWVQVRGHFVAGDFRGQTVPILQVETLAMIDQPPQPYLYP